MSAPASIPGGGSSLLFAEKYTDEQVEVVYRTPPYGEPSLVSNQLVVGPAGVGKTLLLRNLALRAASSGQFPIYVDLTAQGAKELEDELPYDSPDVLSPVQRVHLRAGVAALDRALIAACLNTLERLSLDPRPFQTSVGSLIGVSPSRVIPEVVFEETFRLRQRLTLAKPPSDACLGGKAPEFSAFCDFLSQCIERAYKRQTLFLMDQLDGLPAILQERAADVLRRDYHGQYVVATRPCPGGSDDLRSLASSKPGDFRVFPAAFDAVPSRALVGFLRQVAEGAVRGFGVTLRTDNDELMRTISWYAAGSTRLALSFLLEVNASTRSDAAVHAVRTVCVDEANSLRAETARYIPETTTVLNRWCSAAERLRRPGQKIAALRVKLDYALDRGEPRRLLRILFRENLIHYDRGEHWNFGATPRNFRLNPVLLGAAELHDYLDPAGAVLDVPERVEELQRLFKRARPVEPSRRRVHEQRPSVFVSTRFVDASKEAVAKHPLVAPLVRAAGEDYEVRTGAAVSGGLISEVEKRVKVATVLVSDLTSQRPDVLAEVGLAIGHSIPVLFTVESPERRETLPEFIRHYGIHYHGTGFGQLLEAIADRLNFHSTPQQRWMRGLDDQLLTAHTNRQEILFIRSSHSKTAQATYGAVTSVARANGFTVNDHQPNPDTKVVLDELIRAINRAALSVIDLSGLDNPDYVGCAMIATGLAYAKRYRRLGGAAGIQAAPIIALANANHEVVPTMLRSLCVNSERELFAHLKRFFVDVRKSVPTLLQKKSSRPPK